MEQHLFRYQLVRHIADLRRMEPQNLGVIVQSRNAIRCKFNPYFGRQPGFDRDNLHAWKNFFRKEIDGKAVPLFQPERTSEQFLEYLQNQTRGNYSLTRPLELVMNTGDIEAVIDHLYQSLVRKPEEEPKNLTRPVSFFREELIRRHLVNHPAMKKNRGFVLPDGRKELVQFQYHRDHVADTAVLIQLVPWSNQIQETKGRLETALSLARSVVTVSPLKIELKIVIDNPPKATRDEDEGRALMRQQVAEAKDEFQNGDNTSVVDNRESASKLSDSIEQDLQKVEEEATRLKRIGELAL